MALPAALTLLDVRQAVLVRVGYSRESNHSANITEAVDEAIRSAHAELYPEADWVAGYATATITLSDGVADYDWPDETIPGRIDAVVVVDTIGRESLLEWGSRPNERDIANQSSSGGCPLLVDIVDGVLRLRPTPDDSVASLLVDYRIAPSALTDDAHRIIVDPELVKQLATMKLKNYLGITVPSQDVATHERYLARVRAMHSTGEGFVFGGHKPASMEYRVRRNRISTGRSIARLGYDSYVPW